MFSGLKENIIKRICVLILRAFNPFFDKIVMILSNIEREKMLENIPPYRLEHYEYSSFSQHGEDGVIYEIFNRIKTTNKVFVEIGVEAGVENNTHLLLENGWKGLWIEGSEDYCNEIRKNFSKKLKSEILFLENCFVTKDNIDAAIKKYFTGEIDLLSIDIDGNDFYVLKEITSIKPRVIITEYNANFFPPYKMVMKYDPDFVWKGDDYYGVSLQNLVDYFHTKGYTLAGCDLSGTNAFWVRDDLFTKEKFPYDTNAKILYHPPRYYSESPKGHKSSSKWDSIKDAD